MSLVLDEHRGYLADRVRLDAFRRAIRQSVRPGDVVLDLASGTGILGLLACEAGAARVYAVEATGLIDAARAVAAANGVADRVSFLQAHSRDVTLPEPVDVIVCDQIGHFGFEAGLVENGADARVRFLKPGGRFVPASVELCVAPIEDAGLRAQVDFWRERPAGFDFSPVRTWALNHRYPAMVAATALLGPAAPIAVIDMSSATPGPLAGRADLRVERAGLLHGIAGWFTATLAAGVTMTNAPQAPARLDRSHVFLPIESVTAVEPGDVIRASVHARPAEVLMAWTVEVIRDGRPVARARQSTIHGLFLTRADVQRTDPRLTPTLSPRGRARLSVLELCDGQRTLADIEHAILTRHADVFATLSDAAAFVGDVVATSVTR